MSNLLQHKYSAQTFLIEGRSPEPFFGCCIKYLQNAFVINPFRILNLFFFFPGWYLESEI